MKGAQHAGDSKPYESTEDYVPRHRTGYDPRHRGQGRPGPRRVLGVVAAAVLITGTGAAASAVSSLVTSHAQPAAHHGDPQLAASAMRLQSAIAAVRARTALSASSASARIQAPVKRVQPAQDPHSSFGPVLGCTELEQLWTAAGGPSWAAARAASYAMDESRGVRTATGAAGEMGFWQINPVNNGLTIGGYTIEASYDPITNARDAIALSHGGTDWSAWTTPGVGC